MFTILTDKNITKEKYLENISKKQIYYKGKFHQFKLYRKWISYLITEEEYNEAKAKGYDMFNPEQQKKYLNSNPNFGKLPELETIGEQ